MVRTIVCLYVACNIKCFVCAMCGRFVTGGKFSLFVCSRCKPYCIHCFFAPLDRVDGALEGKRNALSVGSSSLDCCMCYVCVKDRASSERPHFQP